MKARDWKWPDDAEEVESWWITLAEIRALPTAFVAPVGVRFGPREEDDGA